MLGCGGAARTKTIRINSKEIPKAYFALPIQNPKILSPFGKRKRSYHTGIDLRGARGKGDKVYAARSGKVIQAGRMSGYGKVVTLRHADGYKTRYAHLKKIYVKVGQRIKLSQDIGLTGNSGRSSGPHLHFEVISPSGRFINPQFIFKKKKP